MIEHWPALCASGTYHNNGADILAAVGEQNRSGVYAEKQRLENALDDALADIDRLDRRVRDLENELADAQNPA